VEVLADGFLSTQAGRGRALFCYIDRRFSCAVRVWVSLLFDFPHNRAFESVLCKLCILLVGRAGCYRTS
jgi:hypothetical protein